MNEKTNDPTLSKVLTALKTKVREYTRDDGTKAVKAFPLKSGDFGDKLEWKEYKKRVLAVEPLLETVALAMDVGKDTEAYSNARKKALDAVQDIADYLACVGRFDRVTIQKKDVNYVVRLAYTRKINPYTKQHIVTVKSVDCIRGLIEEIMYYHVNGWHVPNVTLTQKTQDMIAKQALLDEKERQAKKHASKTLPGANNGKKTPMKRTPEHKTEKTPVEKTPVVEPEKATA